MDREMLNRNTLLMSLRAARAHLVHPLNALHTPHGKAQKALTAVDKTLQHPRTIKEQGLAPVPGVFVTWKGTDQTIYEVQGLSTWSFTVPIHTQKHQLIPHLPHCIAVKTTKSCIERSHNRIGTITRMPIHWHKDHVSCDHAASLHITGTCDAIPYVSGQTLHVVAYVHVVPMAQYIASQEDVCSSSAG